MLEKLGFTIEMLSQKVPFVWYIYQSHHSHGTIVFFSHFSHIPVSHSFLSDIKKQHSLFTFDEILRFKVLATNIDLIPTLETQRQNFRQPEQHANKQESTIKNRQNLNEKRRMNEIFYYFVVDVVFFFCLLDLFIQSKYKIFILKIY